MSPSPKTRKVKGWTVMDDNGKTIDVSDTLRNSEACYCQSTTIQGLAVFTSKKKAVDWLGFHNQIILPCTITYQLPTLPLKKK